MEREDRDRIVNEWLLEIQKHTSRQHPRARETGERARTQESMKVWLGGPMKGHELYPLRDAIAEVLKREGFDVLISQDYGREGDWLSQESKEVRASDIAIILAVTPGASAEAIELAHDEGILAKLFIYTLDEYSCGYIYRLLDSKYALIRWDSIFSLEEMNRCDSALCLKIWNRACSCASNIQKKKKTRLLISMRSPLNKNSN